MDIKTYTRPTIMDGKVVEFAPEFVNNGPSSASKRAKGGFRISVSRNGVVVHECEKLDSEEKIELFKCAIDRAFDKYKKMKIW